MSFFLLWFWIARQHLCASERSNPTHTASSVSHKKTSPLQPVHLPPPILRWVYHSLSPSYINYHFHRIGEKIVCRRLWYNPQHVSFSLYSPQDAALSAIWRIYYFHNSFLLYAELINISSSVWFSIILTSIFLDLVTLRPVITPFVRTNINSNCFRANAYLPPLFCFL